MPAKKMRVEVFDNDGNRYSVTFQGQITREKALRLLDIVELLGGIPQTNSEFKQNVSEFSKYDKVRYIIKENFPIIWFSSVDAQSLYEQKLNEPISLSTISTYLSRMADRGILLKKGASNRRKYKIIIQTPQRILNTMKNKK